MPVSFYIEGIMTKTKNVGSSGKGFTFDEYTKFIYDTGNGKDPIYFGQSVYFAMLFNYMKDEFIANGKVDLSNEKFAQISMLLSASETQVQACRKVIFHVCGEEYLSLYTVVG